MSQLSNEAARPDGWRSLPLSEVASEKIVYGIVQAGPHDPNGVPYLKSSDVGGAIAIDDLQRTSSEIHAKFGRSKVVPGDIVISLRGNTGATSVVPPDLVEANLTQGTARIAVSKDHDPEFVRQQIASASTQRLIQAATKGSTFVEITLEDLRKIEILCPRRQEQRRIADILSTWDRAIETVEGLITNARDQKRALMQALLTGRTRLPGFKGEWDQRPISAIATRVTRRNDGANLPVLTISSIAGFVRQDEKYRREMAGKSLESYIALNRGEFAYNKGNSKSYQFGCVYELTDYEQALVPHVYVCFRLKKGHCRSFYGALFEADVLAPQLGRLVNTGVRNNGLLNITPKEVLGTTVPVPPEDEQGAIAAVIEAAAMTVKEFRAQLTALKSEKAALMQQLLTGKRRTCVLENSE